MMLHYACACNECNRQLSLYASFMASGQAQQEQVLPWPRQQAYFWGPAALLPAQVAVYAADSLTAEQSCSGAALCRLCMPPCEDFKFQRKLLVVQHIGTCLTGLLADSNPGALA